MKVEYKVIQRKSNEVIFIGTPLEIENKFGVNKDSIYSRSKYGTYYKGMKFERVKDLKEEYAEIKRHLLLYGNTNSKNEPSKIIEMLKDDGIEVIVEHYRKQRKKNALGSYGVSFGEDWILTLKEVKK